jgi:hypothetical protein
MSVAPVDLRFEIVRFPTLAMARREMETLQFEWEQRD